MRLHPRRPCASTGRVTRLVHGCILCALAAGLALSGCRRAEAPPAAAPTPPAAATETAKATDITGTYALVSINDKALPFTVTHEGPGIIVTSGTFTIRPDGTCTSLVAFTLPSGESRGREVGATWTRDGATLTMQWQGAGMTRGTVDGDTFTMDNEGQRFLYRRAR